MNATWKPFFLTVITIALSLTFIIGLAQARSLHQGSAATIYLKNRTFSPSPGVDPALQLLPANSDNDDRMHVLLQMDHIPSPQERATLLSQGIELQQYVPDKAWVAAVSVNQVSTLTTSSSGIRWVGPWQGNDKLAPEIQAQDFPDWAVHPDSGRVQLMVLLHPDVPSATGRTLVETHNGVVAGEITFPPALTAWLLPADIAALAAEEPVLWVEVAPPPLSETNDGAREALNVNIVQSAPYNLDGTGVNLFVFDGGRVDSTHPAFDTRVTLLDTSTLLSDHPTHVAGTAAGNGAGNAPGGRDLKGVAPKADIFSAGYEQSLGTTLFWDNAGDIEVDYALARNTHSVDLGTNSIGSNTAGNGFNCDIHGDYGVTSALLDAIVRGDNATVGSAVMMAWAAGNERTGGSPAGRCGSEFYTTAPPSCAKNPIHVGATNSDGDSMSSFSSWGPCDDGRLKPVVSGPGCESGATTGSEGAINSTTFSPNYNLKCGTSMATPAVAGVMTLGIQNYRAVTGNNSARPSNALMKAWLIHTARDLGLTGPDYIYGYGQVDAVPFINLISDTVKYRTDTITASGKIDTSTYLIPTGTSEFKVSLVWDDFAASAIISDGALALVNDLDLELVAPDGSTTHYPFSLDPANPERTATATGPNTRDNQEQIVVKNPTAGLWTVRVKGTTVPQAPQAYALVHTHTGTTVCSGNLLSNGDFEAGLTGWTIDGTAPSATAVAAPAGGSGQALLVGGDVGSSVLEFALQQVTIPTTATLATLSFDWYMTSDETTATVPFDLFFVQIFNSGLTEALLAGDSRSNAWKEDSWYGNDTIDLSSMAGQTINIRFISINNTTNETSFYVDNATVQACTQDAAVEVSNLSIKNVAPPTVEAGQPLTYTIFVTNTYVTAANNVVITDTVPASTTLNMASLGDGTATGSTPGSVITWTTGVTLTQNQSLSRTFVVVVDSSFSNGQISSTAYGTASNAFARVEDTATTTVSLPLAKQYLPLIMKN